MRRVSTCLQCSGPVIDCSSLVIPSSNPATMAVYPGMRPDLRLRPQHFLSFQARPWSDACRSTPPILELGCDSYRRAQYDHDACAHHRDMSRRYAGALLVKGEVMLLASSYNYPALNIFWTIIEIILWVIWIWILIYVFIDIFRSHDLSGWAKALWFLFVLLIPLIGVLVYLIARGSSMQERSVQQAQQQDRELRAYVQETAGTQTSTADQLAKLADLRDRGVITPEEFERQKAKIMA